MANVSSSNGLEKRPKLRFPDFDESYKDTTLGEIASLVNRTDPKSDAPIMMPVSYTHLTLPTILRV